MSQCHPDGRVETGSAGAASTLDGLIAFERGKNSAVPKVDRPGFLRLRETARGRAEGGALPEGRANVGARAGWAALAGGCAEVADGGVERAGGGGGRVALPKVTADTPGRG